MSGKVCRQISSSDEISWNDFTFFYLKEKPVHNSFVLTDIYLFVCASSFNCKVDWSFGNEDLCFPEIVSCCSKMYNTIVSFRSTVFVSWLFQARATHSTSGRQFNLIAIRKWYHLWVCWSRSSLANLQVTVATVQLEHLKRSNTFGLEPNGYEPSLRHSTGSF